MHSIKLVMIILSFLLVFNSNAAELIMEPHAMLYYQIPLGGGNNHKHKPTFGFRIDNALHESGKQIDYQRLINQEPVFDFKLSNDGVESFKITGVDYLKKYRLLHADGDEEGSVAEDAVESAGNAEGEVAQGEEAVPEEKEGILDKLPGIDDIIEKDQYFGLLLGAFIAVGFAMGVGG